jgi:D-aminoacyl-tRNA deacylase
MGTQSRLQISILSSNEDIASMNVREKILTHYPFVKQEKVDPWNSDVIKERFIYLLPADPVPIEFSLVTYACPSIRLEEHLGPNEILGDYAIVASRHRSESNTPALLCHTPGNWTDDISAGGSAFQIGKGSGLLNHYLFLNLQRFSLERNLNFPVDQEVTHHGPSHFNTSLTFAELGSTEAEWRNQIGGEVVASAIIESCMQLAKNHYFGGMMDQKSLKVCVGIGGTHYMPNFTPHVLKGYGFAHAIPKYKVMVITKEMVASIPERVKEQFNAWVIDWKGLNSAEKQHIMPMLEATGIPILKTKDL